MILLGKQALQCRDIQKAKRMKALRRQVYGPIRGVPGMILRSGKWPVKKLSLAVMFL